MSGHGWKLENKGCSRDLKHEGGRGGGGGGGGRAAATGKLNPVLLWFKVWEPTIDLPQKQLDGDINTQTALNPLYSSDMWAQHMATIKTPSLPEQNSLDCLSKDLFRQIYTWKRIICCTFSWGAENRSVYRTHSSFSVDDDEHRRWNVRGLAQVNWEKRPNANRWSHFYFLRSCRHFQGWHQIMEQRQTSVKGCCSFEENTLMHSITVESNSDLYNCCRALALWRKKKKKAPS